MGVFLRYKVWLLILLLQHHVFTFLPIGRGGQRIRELEDASGARIKVHIAYLLLNWRIYKYIIIIIIKYVQHTSSDAGGKYRLISTYSINQVIDL